MNNQIVCLQMHQKQIQKLLSYITMYRAQLEKIQPYASIFTSESYAIYNCLNEAQI